jgi:hypothetical protein
MEMLWPKALESLLRNMMTLVFAVNVTLDAVTAHSSLFVSENGK